MRIIITITSANPNWGTGGVERYVRAQIEELRVEKDIVFSLFPIRKRINKIELSYFGICLNSKFIGIYKSEQIIKLFKRIEAKKIRCNQFFIHHLLNIDLERTISIINSIIPQSVSLYLHDFYTACPQLNLMKNDMIFCGDAIINESKCHDCKYYKRAKQQRRMIEDFLNRIKTSNLEFIAPSEIVKELWGSAYSRYKDSIQVIPHVKFEGKYNRQCEDSICRVAFVGSQTNNKGWELWENATNKILAEKVNIELYYFGNTKDNRKGIKNVYVSTQEMGKNAMVNALRNNGITFTVLFSICPETYSYTYNESTAADCYIITTSSSGNIAKMVEENKNGVVLQPKWQDLYEYLSNIEGLKKDRKVYKSSGFIPPLALQENIYIGNRDEQSIEVDDINRIIKYTLRENCIERLIDKVYQRKYSEYLG